MIKLRNMLFVLSVMILLINSSVLAENVELDLSLNKTAKLINTSTERETDASIMLTKAGYSTSGNTAAIEAGLAIQWGERGYIDIDLEHDVIITQIKWTKNHVFGAMGTLNVYASNTADFSESVSLGDIVNGEGTFSEENYYRYIRLQKAANFDFYPGKISVYGYKRPFVFNGSSEGSINTDTSIELSFSEVLDSEINTESIQVERVGILADAEIAVNENKLIISPQEAWTEGGVYKITVPSGTVIAQDTRVIDEDIVKYFAVSTDELEISKYTLENNILTLKLHNKTDSNINLAVLTVNFDDKLAVSSVSEFNEAIDGNGDREIFISVSEKSAVYFFEDIKNMKMLLSPFSNAWTQSSTEEAGEVTSAKYVDGAVVVSGNSQSVEMTAFLIGESDEISASAIKAAAMTAVKDGKYVINMTLDSNLTSGNYIVWVSDGKSDVPEKLNVYVLDEGDKQTYAEKIAAMSAEELKTFFELEENEKILTGIGVISQRPENEEEFYSDIEDMKLSGTYDEIARGINTVIALACTRENGIVYGILNYNEYLKVNKTEELYIYVSENELFDESETFMETDYTDVETFKEKLYNSFKLAVFANAPSVEYATEFAEQNNDFFDFDFTGTYSELSAINKKNVINKAMKGSGLSDIRLKFKQAVSDYKKSASTTKPSSGGGGGGTASTSPKIEVTLPEVQINDLSKNDVKPDKEIIFNDLDENHWAYASVTELAQKGIISGYEGNFKPENNVSREEFVKMLVTAADIKGEEAISFEDVAVDAWYYEFVSAAKSSGIISGISDTHFGVGQYITRQDIAVMLYNTLKNLNISFEDKETEMSFDDSEKIADYAQQSVSLLSSINMINGRDNNKFEPNGNATRAEAAELIYRLLNQIS